MFESSTSEGWVIGVDIGGTKIAAGLVEGAGHICHQIRTPMVAGDGAASGMAAVVAAIDSVSAKAATTVGTRSSIRGIGICCPGPLDPYRGVVINPPNLPCWRNFPLAAELSQIYRVPVKLDNDANAAALAEALWGTGRGYRNVFYATVGTGIGTGIVFGGRIYHGRTGAAAEGGHVSIDYRGPRCGCGKQGCIEVLASGPAIAKRARTRLSTEPVRGATILDLAGGNMDAVTSETVGQAFAAGDALAREILDQTVDLLSLWLGNMIDLLEPDIIILGGGVAPILSPFFAGIRDRLPGCCVNSRCQEIPLLAACYGGDSGIAGGAALTSEAMARV
jgi:glucokinase